MILLITSKKQPKYALLILSGSGIIGSWIVWRRWLAKQKKRSHDRMDHIHEEVIFPGWFSEEKDDIQEMGETQEINKAQTCVLYHTYVATNSRDTCTPNHWHATYWLRFIALVEQEPIRAIVQHTDTKRYHVMALLPGEGILSCDDCCSAHEVFRLPVQDRYAYFEFASYHNLDGFTALEQAQEAAKALPILGDFHKLLSIQTKSILAEE